MKRTAFFVLLLLCGCMRMSVESRLEGCPVDGLSSVAFFKGSADGDSLPYRDEEGARVWNFSADGAGVYIRCLYKDDSVTTQILSATVTQCRMETGADGAIRKLSCVAKL